MLASEPAPHRPQDAWARWGVVLFTVVTVAGLFYAKWDPYYHKAFLAAAKHSIGASIISGSAGAAPAPSWQAAIHYAITYGLAIWQALIVGLLVGAGVQVLLPRDWLLRVLGRAGFRSTAIAGLAAVPGMMCTCCASPLAVGLAKSRTSVGATLAFWLGNPTLNPATIVFIGFVLGWQWAVLRIVAGALLVFGVAHLAERFLRREDVPAEAAAARDAAVAQAAVAEGDAGRPMLIRWLLAIWQMCVGLLPEYLVIVVLLGAVRAWLFPAMSPTIGHSLWVVVGLAVAGTLFVIPTAGEVPIVQTLMRFGLGAGGAGALLMTLAPVSLPSLAMVSRAVPIRILAFVALSVAVLGCLSGAVALGLHL